MIIFHNKALHHIAFAALVITPLVAEVAAANRDGDHTTFTNDGTWCWFSDPRAIYRNGKTYAAADEQLLGAGRHDGRGLLASESRRALPFHPSGSTHAFVSKPQPD